MFAGELKARALKLEQEQRARVDKELRRTQKEREAAERHRKRLQDVEDEQSRRRTELVAADLAVSVRSRHTYCAEQRPKQSLPSIDAHSCWPAASRQCI